MRSFNLNPRKCLECKSRETCLLECQHATVGSVVCWPEEQKPPSRILVALAFFCDALPRLECRNGTISACKLKLSPCRVQASLEPKSWVPAG